jgi:hypothetical protein
MSDPGQYLKAIIDLQQAVHRQLREAIAGMDEAELNWTPGPETSSIGTIVTHALGAQSEMLSNVLRIPTNRVRDEEFASKTHHRDDLLALIHAAEDDWRTLAPRIQGADLQASFPRPNKPVAQSGLFWLVRDYGHMREHAAQVNLTSQLYRLRMD